MAVCLNADSSQTAMLKICNVWHPSNISACVHLKWIKILNIPRKIKTDFLKYLFFLVDKIIIEYFKLSQVILRFQGFSHESVKMKRY